MLLYTLPLIFMSVAYFHIVKTLWRRNNMPGGGTTSYSGQGGSGQQSTSALLAADGPSYHSEHSHVIHHNHLHPHSQTHMNAVTGAGAAGAAGAGGATGGGSAVMALLGSLLCCKCTADRASGATSANVSSTNTNGPNGGNGLRMLRSSRGSELDTVSVSTSTVNSNANGGGGNNSSQNMSQYQQQQQQQQQVDRQVSTQSQQQQQQRPNCANRNLDNQLRTRRKVAKMLIAVVIMFSINFFPVHLLPIMNFILDKVMEGQPENPTSTMLYLLLRSAGIISHCMCYFNSAINPIIYYFMSAQFKAQYRRILSCRCTADAPSPRTTRTLLGGAGAHASSNGVSASVVRHMRSRSCLSSNDRGANNVDQAGSGNLGVVAVARARVASAAGVRRAVSTHHGHARVQEFDIPLTGGKKIAAGNK